MKLDLDADNITMITMTIAKAREIDIGNDELSTALDEAQGMVFSGDVAKAYLVIEITK